MIIDIDCHHTTEPAACCPSTGAATAASALTGSGPHTGHHSDDTKRYIDQVQCLDEASRFKIFEGNAWRVYPRLDALLTKRGRPAPTD